MLNLLKTTRPPWTGHATRYASSAPAPENRSARSPRVARHAAGSESVEPPLFATTLAVMRDPRLQKLADVLVNYSVAVKQGQLVRIAGPPAAAPLIAEVYRSTLAAGGHPFVRSAPEELQEIKLKEGSDEALRFVSPIDRFEH